MNADDFMQLVDDVLAEEGRGGLPEDSPARAVIEVRNGDRALQVLAGPGSGKTEALTWRALFDIVVNGTPSNQIMVTTFTRRAATELQVRLVERSDALLRHARRRGIAAQDPHVHDLRVGTLHSLCDSLLAEFDPQYLETGTQLIDDNEALVRAARSHGYGFVQPRSQIVNELVNVTHLSALFRPPWIDPTLDYFASAMRRSSFTLELVGQLTETWVPRRADGTAIGVEQVHGPAGLTGRLDRLLSRWGQYLDDNHILDFRTIQSRFRTGQKKVAGHLSHVFVDEFQDNNPIQFDIHAGWLCTEGVRLTVVGDDDQAIYRFRGSDASCFSSLEPFCADIGVPYRRALLETNYRSTKCIVDFAHAYRGASSLSTQSMPKNVRPSEIAENGVPVRLLTGSWDHVCEAVASELDDFGVGRIPNANENPPSACVLLFSSSERSSRNWAPPALGLRSVLESRGMRVYNPRNKLAAERSSEVGMLLGLLSYLVDPVSTAPVGANGRPVEVWASNHNAARSASALSEPLGRAINDAHIRFQKGFRKPTGRGSLDNCPPNRRAVLNFVDQLRTGLANANQQGQAPRMSVSGFVARLLSLPFFRDSGFTAGMFRQALFTQLLEANIAPTRLTQQSLDMPLDVQLTVQGKFRWQERFWWMLHYFGAFLDNSTMDDLEVDAFKEHAVPVITFHQAKGLEFDHVYVAATGREPDLGPALRTRLFSGIGVPYTITNGLETTDGEVAAMAEGDRDREVYVALTRAKKSLTILNDADGDRFMRLHPVIENLFGPGGTPHPAEGSVEVREWANE